MLVSAAEQHVLTNLEVVVLSLLFGLEPQSSQPSQVLFAYRLVDGRTTPDALPVVVCDVRPPVRLSRKEARKRKAWVGVNRGGRKNDGEGFAGKVSVRQWTMVVLYVVTASAQPLF